MAMQEGEMYRCHHCHCEIEVRRGADPGRGGDLSPRCCCGEEMSPAG